MNKAILVGEVTRVAKLYSPARTEFTVDVRETTLNGELFTIGDKLTFVVDTSQPTTVVQLTNLSVGDETTINAEQGENGCWNVVSISNRPHRGRPASDFLNDLVEEQNRRK